MIIPEKLKLNRFRHVPLKEGRDLFAQFGFTRVQDGGYNGDADIAMSQSKLDAIKAGERINEQKLREEYLPE